MRYGFISGEFSFDENGTVPLHRVIFSPVLSLLLFVVLLSGCGPELSKNDLGVILPDVPKISGSDEPYQLPELGPVTEEEKNIGRRGNMP